MVEHNLYLRSADFGAISETQMHEYISTLDKIIMNRTTNDESCELCFDLDLAFDYGCWNIERSLIILLVSLSDTWSSKSGL